MMDRIVIRTLPNGKVCKVHPFHICLKGLEQAVLCRDSADYDAMVKVLCVSARRKNVIVIIYGVVSNHCHIAVLAASQQDADAYARDIKKVYSMWFYKKYGEKNILHRTEIKALYLDSNWYVRNVLAYIPRNALDNGCSINDYPWSGYRAMFWKGDPEGIIKVSQLNRRDCKAVMHTGDKLGGVPWTVDKDGHLDPRSFCDYRYLEQAFNGDQAFFLKTIGGQNAAEMRYLLEEKPYALITDEQLYKLADEICQRWFDSSPSEISTERKIRVISYLFHTQKTTVAQMARIMQMPREQISRLVKK